MSDAHTPTPAHHSTPSSLAFWVLGTDTEIGKTAVALGLLRAFDRAAALRSAPKPRYLKPVQTGVPAHEPNAGDAGTAASKGFAAKTLFAFAAPASPELAARLEGRTLRASTVLAAINDALEGGYGEVPSGSLGASPSGRLTLIEGAGGLLVPLNDRETMLDLVRESGLPAVLVVGNKLGALNHARLSIDRLRLEGVPLLGIILNRTAPVEALDPGTLPAQAAGPESPESTHAALPESARSRAAAAQRVFLSDNAARLACVYADVPVPVLADLGYGEIDSPEGSAQLDRAAARILAALRCPGGRCDDPKSVAHHRDEDAFALPGAADKLLALDAAHIWHPYANPLMPPPIELVESARGVRVTVVRSQRAGSGQRPARSSVASGALGKAGFERLTLIDGTSAWWCAPFGASHPRLIDRLKRQASDFAHVMFGGLTHRPAIELTERLLALLPGHFSKVFYSDSGSVAIEVARKTALQYQQAAGRPEKRRFLVPLGGYHGDTAGAMSFCDPKSGMHARFNDTIRSEIFIEPPDCRFDARFGDAALEAARRAFAEKGSEIAAVVLEPVAQCAGGMRFYHPDYLKGIATLARAHGALLIFDEIATGFGRTGRNFAFEHAGVAPDILCVGKALTGGIMGMAATISTRRVVETIGLERPEAGGGVFPHGPTYMANPLAAAVASESLALFASRNWLHEAARLEALMRSALEPAKHHPAAADVRVLGAIGVIELKHEPNCEAAARMRSAILAEGVWLRPFGRLLYTMPAFTTTDDEMRVVARAMVRALDALGEPAF